MTNRRVDRILEDEISNAPPGVISIGSSIDMTVGNSQRGKSRDFKNLEGGRHCVARVTRCDAVDDKYCADMTRYDDVDADESPEVDDDPFHDVVIEKDGHLNSPLSPSSPKDRLKKPEEIERTSKLPPLPHQKQSSTVAALPHQPIPKAFHYSMRVKPSRPAWKQPSAQSSNQMNLSDKALLPNRYPNNVNLIVTSFGKVRFTLNVPLTISAAITLLKI